MRSEITIDLGALRRNARRLLDALGGAELWAVVKANGYGHGAVDCAGRRSTPARPRSASRRSRRRSSSARRLPEPRILVLGPTPPAEIAAAREARLELGVGAAIPEGMPVHVKLDTGMGRWGVSRAAGAAARGRRPDDASRHRRQRSRLRAPPARALSRGDRARYAAPHAPRREQRRRAAAPRVALRRGALRDRALRPLAVRDRPRRRRARAGALLAKRARAREAAARRRVDRLRPPRSSPSATRGSGSSRSATPTASAAT